MERARLALLCAALAPNVACNKDASEEKAKPAEAKAVTEAGTPAGAASKTVAGQDLLAQIDACSSAFNRWDKEAYRACFAEKTEAILVDSIEKEVADTPTEVVVQSGVFRSAFSDYSAIEPVVLVNGRRAALFGVMSGTHDGRSLGMDPTGKRVVMYYGRALETDDQGRVVIAREYLDQATLLHQLGIQESATAPATENPPGEKIRIAATGSDVERANVALVVASFDALDKGDVPRAMAMYADDATYRSISDARPYNGVKEIASGTADYLDLSNDFKVTVRDAWGAGDWVVAEVTTTARLAKELAEVPLTKGKPWAQNSLEFLQLERGKVKRHLSLSNSLKFSVDVGLVDPAQMGAVPVE